MIQIYFCGVLYNSLEIHHEKKFLFTLKLYCKDLKYAKYSGFQQEPVLKKEPDIKFEIR